MNTDGQDENDRRERQAKQFRIGFAFVPTFGLVAISYAQLLEANPVKLGDGAGFSMGRRFDGR